VTRDTAPAAPSVNTATAILNAGVMAEMGSVEEERAKFLFDPLYDDHFGSLEELTPELIEAIVTGAAPYDGVDAVFVSHAHGDHFSASLLARMLGEQSDLVLVMPQQALTRLTEHPLWDPMMEERVRTIALENGEASETFEIAGAQIEAFRSPHNGWPERHAEVHNITYRVSIPTSVGMAARVMHVGDADPGPEHYAELDAFLKARRTSLAMVPFWFYSESDVDALVDETLNAESVVAMHVPREVPPTLSEGERPYFSGVGQMLEIVATPE
jgi:L-ascorbate metabolism protein UlaG (beta-lactamase superfamily)